MPEYNNVLGTIFYIVTAYNKLAFDQELSSPLHALQAFDLSYIFFKYQNEKTPGRHIPWPLFVLQGC